MIIGREKEIAQLLEAASSEKTEVVAVYGRRRVGKTFLINEAFHSRFDFYHTGLSPIETKELKKQSRNKTVLQLQLLHFYYSLKEYGMQDSKVPDNWLEAFHMLSMLLTKTKEEGKKQIVFFDELPWLDTDKSFFITAFESFCNNYANREKLLIVIAGSAISWIMKKLINNYGGLYGRVSKEILVKPFSLAETEQMLSSKRISYSRYDITRTYMVFGGIPYYLDYLDPRLSLPENVDALFFAKQAILSLEFDRLFQASFDNAKLTKTIAQALSKKNVGLTRDELLETIGYGDGQTFSDALKALELSGYVAKYSPFQEGRKRAYYKLVDPFCLFYLRFVADKESLDAHFFSDSDASDSLNAWKGFAFETVCYNHLEQIKAALGVRSVAMSRFSFIYRGGKLSSGAQIDLVLERRDNVVNLCEMKFYNQAWRLTFKDQQDLNQKTSALALFLKKSQSIQTVLVSTFGVAKGEYQWTYQRVLTLDDLFADFPS